MSLDTNLISYWKLDESSGNAADSVGSNTGTMSGTYSYAAGKLNNALTMDSGAWFKSTISTGLSNSFSVAAWFNFPNADATNNLFNSHVSSYDNYWFIVNRNTTTETLTFNMYDGTNNPNGETTITVPNSTWTHIAFVRNTTDDKIYGFINGTLAVTITDTTTSTPSYGTFGLGEDRNATDRPFFGSVDEMGLWSRALSATEVAELYNSGNGLQYPFSTANTTNFFNFI